MVGHSLLGDAPLMPVNYARTQAAEDRRTIMEKILLFASLCIPLVTYAAAPVLPPVDESRLLAGTEARIRAARTAPLTVRISDANGKPAANQKVRVEHVKHLFYFGAGFDTALLPRDNETEIDRRHRESFLKLFNYATVHLYWGGYEPKLGEVQSADRLRSIQWLREHGVTPRGHPIFWNHTGTLPAWLKNQNPGAAELRGLMDVRLAEMSRTVLPQLHDIDVWNELVHWERMTNPLTSLIVEQGKVPVVAHYLKDTKRLNPQLQLVVNDYEHSPSYYALLKQLIDAGAPIDIIGQQSHMHDGTWSVKEIWDSLERLTLLGRPVLFTETSVLSGPKKKMDWLNKVPDWNSDPENEQKQADFLAQFFRLLYSHTNCAGVVLWDYADRRAWLGAPVGVLRKDGSPKPSFERLDQLINRDWRTRGEFVTDAKGEVVVPNAFEGEYRVQAGGAEQKGVHRRNAPLTMTLR